MRLFFSCFLLSISPLSDQPAALVRWHLVFLGRLRYRALLVQSINDADQSGGRPTDVVDGPGMLLLV
jgi:hypothetical protein